MKGRILTDATLSRIELEKYGGDRLEAFISKIERGEPFVAVGDTEPTIVLKKDPELYADLRNSLFPARFDTADGQSIALSKLQKTPEFGGQEGGKIENAERQEHGLINLINANPGTVINSLGMNIKSAESKIGHNKFGKEPYIDIYIVDDKNKQYGVSCKGNSAPSLAGGGASGIKAVAPELLDKVFTKLEDFVKNQLHFQHGDIVNATQVPDVYIRIPDEFVELLL